MTIELKASLPVVVRLEYINPDASGIQIESGRYWLVEPENIKEGEDDLRES